MKVCSVLQCIWPQSKVDCLRPVGARVKQLLARTLQEVADGLLGNAILEVSIYTTKGKLLARIMTCPLEGVVVELPIVAVVVEDFHSVFGRVLLKGKLGSNCHCQ